VRLQSSTQGTPHSFIIRHRRHEGVLPVGDGVGLRLGGVLQEPVDEDGPLRRDVHRHGEVLAQHALVVDHLHGPAAEDVTRAHNKGVADARGHGDGLGAAPDWPVAGHAPSVFRVGASAYYYNARFACKKRKNTW
jgi:hypothetical protein